MLAWGARLVSGLGLAGAMGRLCSLGSGTLWCVPCVRICLATSTTSCPSPVFDSADVPLHAEPTFCLCLHEHMRGCLWSKVGLLRLLCWPGWGVDPPCRLGVGRHALQPSSAACGGRVPWGWVPWGAHAATCGGAGGEGRHESATTP